MHTTSAGTQGLVNASGADEIITGSFVNIKAVVDYIKTKSPDLVSLVAMGEGGQNKTEEDIFCAHYFKNLLLDEKPEPFINIRKKLKAGSGAKFFEDSKEWFTKRDFELCLKLNRFDFVIKAVSVNGAVDGDLMGLTRV